MAYKETFAVVVGVNEPAGDAVGAVTDDFAGLRFEDVHAIHLHSQIAAFLWQQVNIRLAEDDKKVSFAGVLEILGHVQVGVHARLEHGDAAQLAELRGVRLVVEGASDEHVEIGIARLAGCLQDRKSVV